MRSLNDYFDIELVVADISTTGSQDIAVIPDNGKVTKALSVLYGTIATADSDLYLFKGKPITLSAAANATGGKVTFTTGTTPHGMIVGDCVFHLACADPNYDGIFKISAVPSALSYTVTATWTATEATGTIRRVIGDGLTEGNGKCTVAYSGSVLGDVDSITPSGPQCVVNEGDLIGVISDGASTNAIKSKVRVTVTR